MGSSAKGGAGTSTHYIGTIPVLICRGPIRAIKGVLIDGERIWTGLLQRSNTTNPVNIVCPAGTIVLHWGTEDQEASTILNAYEAHPPYRGICYAILWNWDCGVATNAPNIEFIVEGGAPEQTVITGAVADDDLDAGTTVNGVVFAAEIITSPAWHGFAADRLVAASWQSLAESLQGSESRPLCATSPLIDDQVSTRSLLGGILSANDAWARITPAGQIEVGRWTDSDPGDVTTLTHADFTEVCEPSEVDDDDPPNSYAVEFMDRTALHKGATTIVDDRAGIVSLGRLNRMTLNREDLITYAQAQAGGAEALRLAASRGSWSGAVRIGKARTPAGERLQPGDYLRVPATPACVVEQVAELVRITQITWPANAVDDVQVEADRCPLSAAALAIALESPDDSTAVAVPPINRARVFVLPGHENGAQPPVYLVACRPADTALGYYTHFDAELGGDFPRVATATNWALPVALDGGLITTTSTLTLSLLPAGAAGQDYQRDASLLREWTGGALEGRNDELLVVLVNGDGTVEVCSVSGTPTLVEADTFTVSVLRGRRGTAAATHAAGAEAWVVLSAGLVEISHADLLAAAETGDLRMLYFRPGAYQLRAAYSASSAYSERIRRVDDELVLAEYAPQPDAATWYPTLSLVIPGGYYRPPDGPLPGGSFEDIDDGLFDGPISGAMEWRYVGGLCLLCGFEELTKYAPSPYQSSPPKKYRTKTESGSYRRQVWYGCPCDDPTYYLHDSTTARSGSCVYDPQTCQLGGSAINTYRLDYSSTGEPTGTTETPLGCWGDLGNESTVHATLALTPTSYRITWDGLCHDIGQNSQSVICTGYLESRLSDEDTEDDARARMRAAAGGWTAWDDSAASAARQIRTTGYGWWERQVQYRGQWTGCVPYWTYRVEIETRVRSYAGGDWSAGGTITITRQADGAGVLTVDESDLPCAADTEVEPTAVHGPIPLI